MAAPYDPVINAINSARAQLADKIETLQPDNARLLENPQFFTQALCISAYRKMQSALVAMGYTTLRKETILEDLPALTQNDPSTFVSLNWSSTVPLPADLIAPTDCQERVSGINPATKTGYNFRSMDLMEGMLPYVAKTWYNGFWQWLTDELILPGATLAFDLRIRYKSYLPDFEDDSPNQGIWFTQPIQIARSQECLAAFICAEAMTGLKEWAGAAAFLADANTQCRLIMGMMDAQASDDDKTQKGGAPQ